MMLLILLLYVVVCMSELRDYVTIKKTRLPISNSIVTSIEPQGWLTRSIKSSRSSITNSVSIKEVIYIPCPLSFESSNDYIGDDDHFCSYLCDKGYPVHILSPSEISSSSYQKAIAEIVKWRMELSIPARTIALITNEIVSPWVLSYLKDIALPMTVTRQDIGAVVIIDPPPLLSYTTNNGQRNVVKRYTESYNSFEYYMNTISSSSYNRKSKVYHELSWKGYRKRLREIKGLREILETNDVNDNVNSPVDTNVTVDYGNDFRLFTGMSEQKVFDYDRAVFLASIGNNKKKKKLTTRRLASSSISVKTNEASKDIHGNTNFIPLEIQSLNDLLGAPPIGTKILSLTEALRDRILVVSTIKENKNSDEECFGIDSDINNKHTDYSIDDLDSFFPVTNKEDNWGYEAANEMATMYKAGPVIEIDNDNDDDDDDGNDNDNEDNINEGDSDDDNINECDDNNNHQKTANIVTDWFSMLSSFGYL